MIWEMRYSGYEEVDSVGLYAFYFALAVELQQLLFLGWEFRLLRHMQGLGRATVSIGASFLSYILNF